MIEGARTLFTGLPIAFGDPLALAGSQVTGKLTLIVVRYPEEAIYDCFVCQAPLLVMAARVTPAFKYPVPLARALAQFYRARGESRPGTMSLYETDPSLLSLFMEAVHFTPSLSLMMECENQDFIQRQLKQVTCTDGMLELGDFSDPAHPALALHPVNSILTAQAWLDEIWEAGSTKCLQLYDREKNQRMAQSRGQAFPETASLLEAAAALGRRYQEKTAQAMHLATRREKTSAGEELQEVDTHLQQASEELQMRNESLLVQEMSAVLAGTPAVLLEDATGSPPDTVSITVDDPAAARSPARVDAGRQKLLGAIRKIYQVVQDELRRQFGEERAEILMQQAVEGAGMQLPLQDQEILPLLRILVTSNPPRRWMRFRHRMNEVKDLLAAELTAVFAEYNYLGEDEVMAEVSELWGVCSKG